MTKLRARSAACLSLATASLVILRFLPPPARAVLGAATTSPRGALNCDLAGYKTGPGLTALIA
jgi:hypothetical protein